MQQTCNAGSSRFLSTAVHSWCPPMFVLGKGGRHRACPFGAKVVGQERYLMRLAGWRSREMVGRSTLMYRS